MLTHSTNGPPPNVRRRHQSGISTSISLEATAICGQSSLPKSSLWTRAWLRRLRRNSRTPSERLDPPPHHTVSACAFFRTALPRGVSAIVRRPSLTVCTSASTTASSHTEICGQLCQAFTACSRVRGRSATRLRNCTMIRLGDSDMLDSLTTIIDRDIRTCSIVHLKRNQWVEAALSRAKSWVGFFHCEAIHVAPYQHSHYVCRHHSRPLSGESAADRRSRQADCARCRDHHRHNFVAEVPCRLLMSPALCAASKVTPLS